MSESPTKLLRPFFERPTLKVAPELIGKRLVFESPDGRLSARIVEVEVYIGLDDPACHAARGKTSRNAPMFGPGGFSYVYFIYGMYNCLNFVTEPEGAPAAVLIRGAEPLHGIDLMRQNSPRLKSDHLLLAGPGRLCRSMGITTVHTNMNMENGCLFVEDTGECPDSIQSSPRVGIKEGTELLWRFYDVNSRSVSKV